MADIIQLLPDAIANQIAAGEVIQRPASVVKELLENSVDAGATNIKLLIKDAGKTLIQVIDDGCGMSPTDARMSFERHATSKIRAASDLFAIRTMGFRGEALASIAAVAQVEMKTRLHADDLGTRLVCEDSAVKQQEPCQTAPGTSIAVKNLFYNVPARRNFLKSDTVELRHLLDEFQRVALGNPDVGFVVHHNNNEMYHLTPGNLRQRITGVFGAQINKRLVPVDEDTDVVKVRGFVGKPEFAKKVRGEQLFFVNNRFIRSSYLNHAVMTAYESLLQKDTFPFYAVFLDIDPARIDVNVHPTKQEIKFEDERLIYNYLRVAIRHALGKYGIMPTLDFDQETSFNVTRPYQGTSSRDFRHVESSHAEKKEAETVATAGRSEPRDFRSQNNLALWESLYAGLGKTDDQELDSGLPEQQTFTDNQPITIESSWNVETAATEETLLFSQQHKAPFQIHGAYIVSPIKSGFFLVDQQAAHERILFEKYLHQLNEGPGGTQQQLFPKTLTLPPHDSALLIEILPQINALGFDIQDFGHHSFVVHGIPAELGGQADEIQLIESLLEQFKSGLALQLDIRQNLARSMARSAAIKRGQLLSEQEMQALIDQLFACEAPFRSPFGRKCFLTYELDELDKLFSK